MERVPPEKIQALQLLPGARRLLHVIGEVHGAWLVGGSVRDLLLGFVHIDLDIAFEGDAAELAEFLAGELDGEAVSHERFNTATVRWGDRHTVDIAGTRTEIYERPGALPTVAPSDIEHDLARRDFSVNAIAMALWRREIGRLAMFPGAFEDLMARLLRVLHDDSFVDDPTRLLRLVRYGARLGFAAEPHTEQLARDAIARGALGTVSWARIGDELLDLFGERSAVVAIDAMAALGLDRALHPQFVADEYVAARAALTRDEGLRHDLVLLAACMREMDAGEAAEFAGSLNLTAGERDTVLDGVEHARGVAAKVAGAQRHSEVAAAMRHRRPETAALAAALPESDAATRASLQNWLAERTRQHLLIGGADLRQAGVPEGPEIGRALAATLARALDGELTDRERQLEFALAAVREAKRDDVAD